MQRVLVCLLICLPVVLPAQQKTKENPRYSLRGCIGIPRTLSSQMFRTSFNGVVEMGLSANVRLIDNFYSGLGYQYSNFVNNKELFVFYKAGNGSLSYNTRLIAHDVYLKAGYDRYFSDIGYMSYAINGGFMAGGYDKVNPDSSAANTPFAGKNFSTPYIQPELSVNFMVEDAASFSILLSYTSTFYKFDPKAPRFYHIDKIKESRNRAYMGWLNLGIGFTIFIKGN